MQKFKVGQSVKVVRKLNDRLYTLLKESTVGKIGIVETTGEMLGFYISLRFSDGSLFAYGISDFELQIVENPENNERNENMLNFEHLKPGDKVKLKKLEECKSTEELENMDHFQERAKFAEQIVTISKILSDKKIFKILEDKQSYYYDFQWIDKLCKVEICEDEKVETSKSSNSENKPKSSQIFQLVKCGKVIQTFPTLEECEEFFKKEFSNLQKDEVLTISQVLKVAKLSVSVENLNDSQNLKDEKVEKFKIGDNVKFIDGADFEVRGTIYAVYDYENTERATIMGMSGNPYIVNTSKLKKIS